MTWNWAFAEEILPRLLDGFVITIVATVLGAILALTLGLAIAIVRKTGGRWTARAVHGASEFIRRTPLLVQLFFLFYVLPDVGIELSPLAAGVIGLGLHYSTYAAEIYRAGIDSVGRGQWEAATTLGFSPTRVWGRVVLPQALPRVYPALGGNVIQMFKETALLSAITVQEVLGVAREIGTESYAYTEPLLIAGALYLSVSCLGGAAVRLVERRGAVRA